MTDADARAEIAVTLHREAQEQEYTTLTMDADGRRLIGNSMVAFASRILDQYIALRFADTAEPKGETQ